MSFQFNFNIEDQETSPGERGVNLSETKKDDRDEQPGDFEDSRQKHGEKNCDFGDPKTNSVAKETTVFGKPATEHHIPEDIGNVLENKILESSLGLKFVNVSVVEMTLSNSEADGEGVVQKSTTSNSDLIPGVYEGGMKIWECTFDLLKYFEEEEVDFGGQSVLDLGCGAGLLGIFSLRRKAEEVHFQDYNGTVIEEITIPNALVNCDADDSTQNTDIGGKRSKKSDVKPGLLSRCRFFSGEWSSFTQLMQNRATPVKYDVILTSETIYNPAHYSALCDVFRELLADDGIIYLASKSHYFGVGGGVHLFETFIQERKLFNIRTLKVHDDGLQRMLLSLDFAHDS